MSADNKQNVLSLFKSAEDFDPIHSRLCSISEILNNYAEDPLLDQVHNKVLEAIDWYERFLDQNGDFGDKKFEDKKQEEQNP